MRTLIIIPSYNEEENLPHLIEDIKSYNYDYLIINDNSKDNTEQLAKEKGYNILNLPFNVGLAGVTQIGFKYAYENGYDCVVSVDGDGQHQPKYVHDLIKVIEEGADYVVGSRFLTKEKPMSLRMFGSRLICLLIKIKTGEKVTDPTSGMRALGKKVIKSFSEDMNFYAEPDTLYYLLKKKYVVKEAQVEMVERVAGVSYFKGPFKSIKYMFNVVLSILLIR